MKPARPALPLPKLREVFGAALQENVGLANFTTAHVGGPAAALIPLHTPAELERAVRALWDLDLPFRILGSGSNLLVSDEGYAGVILVNRTRNIRVDAHSSPVSVHAESGANLGGLARQVALRGLSGMEWAASIPGTVGGAVVGNAGAHGGDMAGNLLLAEILHRTLGRQNWTAAQMGYAYRTSLLKREPGQAIVLGARLSLSPSTPEAVQQRMDEFATRRRATQPPGASLGSMFKNPPGDYAGRLIEAAGLKGTRVGAAEISPVHANFFINLGGATAADLAGLIALARRTVLDQFGVRLEMEVELLGPWPTLEEQE